MLEQNSGQLDSLRVEDCASSRPEDKEEILAKIGSVSEIAKFNEGLRQLLLGSEGISDAQWCPFWGLKVPL